MDVEDGGVRVGADGDRVDGGFEDAAFALGLYVFVSLHIVAHQAKKNRGKKSQKS